MAQMKSLNGYEVVDQAARDRISKLENNSSSIIIDSALSLNSSNPVQNKVITNNLNNKIDTSEVLTLEEIQASTDLTGKIADAEATFKLACTSLMISSATYYRGGSFSLSSSRITTFSSTNDVKYIYYQFTATIKRTNLANSDYFCSIYYILKGGTPSQIIIPLTRSGYDELSVTQVFIPENVELYVKALGIEDEIRYKAYLLKL